MASPRVLIVDDESHIVRVLSLILTRQGYEVQVADNGLTAWDLAVQTPPDLVIADQQMPGLTGIELATRLKAQTQTENVPVMIVTARQLHPNPDDARETNVTEILPKPFSPKRLIAHVVELIGPADVQERCAG